MLIIYLLSATLMVLVDDDFETAKEIPSYVLQSCVFYHFLTNLRLNRFFKERNLLLMTE